MTTDVDDDVFLTIRWSFRDLLVALARRLPEFEDSDIFEVLDEDLSPERVGVTQDQLEHLANEIEGVLEDISVSRGWDVIEDSLNWHLGYPDDRREKGEHPNAVREGTR